MLRLLFIVGAAALFVTTALFAVALALVKIGFNPDLTPVKGEILTAMALLFLIGVATWWVFRKLRIVYTRREARAVSVAFGAFTPISVVVATFIAEISGGYAELLVGSRYSGLVGAYIGTAIITGLLTFLVCGLVLRITRLAVSVEQSDST